MKPRPTPRHQAESQGHGLELKVKVKKFACKTNLAAVVVSDDSVLETAVVELSTECADSTLDSQRGTGIPYKHRPPTSCDNLSETINTNLQQALPQFKSIAVDIQQAQQCSLKPISQL